MDRLRQSACYCYIVECADGSYYTGWTTDPEKRLRAHNSGRGARYTRARRPVRLVLLEAQPDRAGAMKRERSIKSMSRARKMELIQPARQVRGPESDRPGSSARRRKTKVSR
ncbi:MAG TPA: GIY-YIG nuclease family protein [Anaerolineales bacterium]